MILRNLETYKLQLQNFIKFYKFDEYNILKVYYYIFSETKLSKDDIKSLERVL